MSRRVESTRLPDGTARRLVCTLALSALALLGACGGGAGADPSAANASASGTGQSQILAAAAGGGSGAALSGSAAPTVTALTKLSEVRVGRTTYDYVFKVTLRNGDSAQTGLSAQIMSTGAGTTVVDGSVQVGDLAAGALTTPADTVTLRQDRLQAFNAAALVWQFTASGPVPASLALSLSQRVVAAGVPVTVQPTVLDANGQVITSPPAISYTVEAVPQASVGTLPGVTAGELISAADTRGNYTLRATLAGTGLSASVGFTVLQNGTQSVNAALYTGLSAAQGSLARQLTLAAAAQQRGDAAALSAAAAAINAAALTIVPTRLAGSSAYEPDAGFIPSTARLQAAGILPQASDSAYGTATTQLRNKLAQITQLLTAPSGNDAADTALLTQYRNDLAVIAATLRAAGTQPSLYGMVLNASTVSDLLAKDMPALSKAMAASAQTQIALGAGKAAQAVQGNGEGRMAPSFFLGGMLSALGPMGELINELYGDYLNQIANATILLAAKDLLDATLPQVVRLEGLLAGASQSFFAYNASNSILYTAGTTVAEMQSADVYVVGNAAVEALGGAASAVTSLPKNPRKLSDLMKYFKGVMDAIDGVGEAYDLAHQQPGFVLADSFDNGGCLFAVSDSCVELHYPAGFKNVAGGKPFAFTVLFFVRTGGPRPQYGSKVFNFAPST